MILDDAVLLQSACYGALTWTNYEAIPQLSISEIERYRRPSAISNINYGQDTSIEIPEHPSDLIHISPTFYGYDVMAGTIKGVFLADKLGRLFVVVHFRKDSLTPGSPLIICLPVGTCRIGTTEYGAVGHTVGVFVDNTITQSLKVAVYSHILHDIGERLSKEQDGLHTLPNAKVFTDPRPLTMLGIDTPLTPNAIVWGFNEGTGRILIYNHFQSTCTILDMMV